MQPDETHNVPGGTESPWTSEIEPSGTRQSSPLLSGDSEQAMAKRDGPDSSGPRRLAYLSAYRYVFENSEWFPTLVFATVFSFLPVFGRVAMWGYAYEILESLHRRPDSPYPKFEFGRCGEYCVRGVWPYVLEAAMATLLTFVLQIVYQVTLQGGLMLWLSNPQLAAIVTGIVAPILAVGLLLLAVSVAVGMGPFWQRAGLTQDIRLVFRLGWIKGYWARVWPEQILAYLFQLAATAVLLPLGCILFGVGFFAALTVLWIAGTHIQWQIYEIYLERGGEPIPLHPLPAEAPPVQVELPLR